MSIGVIFCEIVNEVILRNQKPNFLLQINLAKSGNEDVIRNFQLALAEIREHCEGILPAYLQNVTPQSLVQVAV